MGGPTPPLRGTPPEEGTTPSASGGHPRPIALRSVGFLDVLHESAWGGVSVPPASSRQPPGRRLYEFRSRRLPLGWAGFWRKEKLEEYIRK